MAKENWRDLVFPDVTKSENEFEQGSKAVLVRPEFVNREEQLGSVSFQIPTGCGLKFPPYFAIKVRSL